MTVQSGPRLLKMSSEAISIQSKPPIAALYKLVARCLTVLAFAVYVFAAVTYVSGGDATVSEILAHPSNFDGQHVTVSGTARYVRPRTSRRGNDYETFSLCDQTCLNVFTWGHPNVAEGKHISVNGTFDEVKQVGRYTFRNEIDADEGSL